MKRLLVGLLLIAVVGCGDSSPPQSVSTPPASSSAVEPATTVATPPTNVAELHAQAPDVDPIAALEKLSYSRIERNEQGKVVGVELRGPKITDAGLVHLKGLTKLETLFLGCTQITDDGLVTDSDFNLHHPLTLSPKGFSSSFEGGSNSSWVRHLPSQSSGCEGFFVGG